MKIHNGPSWTMDRHSHMEFHLRMPNHGACSTDSNQRKKADVIEFCVFDVDSLEFFISKWKTAFRLIFVLFPRLIVCVQNSEWFSDQIYRLQRKFVHSRAFIEIWSMDKSHSLWHKVMSPIVLPICINHVLPTFLNPEFQVQLISWRTSKCTQDCTQWKFVMAHRVHTKALDSIFREFSTKIRHFKNESPWTLRHWTWIKNFQSKSFESSSRSTDRRPCISLDSTFTLQEHKWVGINTNRTTIWSWTRPFDHLSFHYFDTTCPPTMRSPWTVCQCKSPRVRIFESVIFWIVKT